MKNLILLLLVLASAHAYSQDKPRMTFKVAADTSFLEFDQMPRLSVARTGTGGNVRFQLPRADFKALTRTVSFLQQNRSELIDKEILYKKQIVLNDSATTILKLKCDAEAQRAENFKNAFEEAKSINDAQHTQLVNCIEDMKKLNNERQKGKALTFLKGILWGLAIGSVGGIVAGAAL